MQSDTAPEPRQRKTGPKRIAGLLLLMAALLALMVFGYYRYAQARSSVINQDYFRVLAEASNIFTENLIKLQSLYDYQESETAIRALFPSYKVTHRQQLSGDCPQKEGEQSTTPCASYRNRYWLTQDKVQLRWYQQTDNNTVNYLEAEIQHADFLPEPERGFSQLLFVTEDSQVLASTGGETTISFVNLTSVTEALSKQQYSDFFSEVTDSRAPPEPRLPSYSVHLDMELSYGDYRLFIYPMRLAAGLVAVNNNAADQAVSQLYLVGLLPQQQLAEQGSGYWNIPLLFATLVSLTFVWSVLRMYLQPKNQSVNRLYASFCYLVAYGFFSVLLALIFSYLTVTVWQQSRQQQAQDYIEKLRADLTADIHAVFSDLQSYSAYYQQHWQGSAVDKSLLPAAATLKQINYQQKFAPCSKTELAYDFYPKLMHVDADKECTMQTYYLQHYRQNSDKNSGQDSGQNSTAVSGKLLSVSMLDAAGRSRFPSMYFLENNAAPKVYDLSHRDYFKRVRNGNGWQLTLKGQSFDNVYIQRLLNVNNGTRGTTIAMPLQARQNENGGSDSDSDREVSDAGFVLVADVVLPSVSLAPPSANGLQFMVVERRTGKVLYHNDNSRTFVENIYYIGSESNLLSQTVRSGEPTGNSVRTGLTGFYHGQPGNFILTGSPVDEWALVLFYPQDHVDAIMSNQFLIFSVSMIVFFLLLITALQLLRRFVNSKLVKNRLGIPLGFDSRRLLLLVSLVWGLVYGFFALRTALQLTIPSSQLTAVLPWLSAVLFLLIIGCVSLFLRQRKPQAPIIKPGAKLIIAGSVAVISLLPFSYLSYISKVPQQALQAHYAKMQCIEFNRERAELHEFAINRFPNSITEQRLQPTQLLPVSWSVATYQQRCAGVSSSGLPDDYPKLSTIIGNTYLWQWVKTFLVRLEPLEMNSEAQRSAPDNEHGIGTVAMQTLHDTSNSPKTLSQLLLVSVQFLLPLLLFLVLWQLYVRRVLWLRLGYDSDFLRHIYQLSTKTQLAPATRLVDGLQLQLSACPPAGVNLLMLLKQVRLAQSDSALLPGFEQLYQRSATLQQLEDELQNVSIMLQQSEPGKPMQVTLSQIDTGLNGPRRRQLLLGLITELKALTLLGELSKFTLVMGFNSLQRLTIKDEIVADGESALQQSEYLTWSECLLNFNVQMPDTLAEPLDADMLQQEIDAYPLLGPLPATTDQLNTTQAEPRPGLWRGSDGLTTRQWATLNFILTHADALYRYKWEGCSNEEKLALFNLANGHQLNPLNCLMIEHLAINGLLRVSRGKLTLVNRSFRQFVQNAEPSETLRQLVKVGEAGVWKNYRLSFAALAVVIVGGIALTSGQSLHIVAASIAGVLGSMISVFSSGSSLRSYFKS
ncbi:hypothetical protein [Arsukibacterium sp. UBA3155]|uniref:hypothetical protein n=1 Tax=Arsukibacterium sp. UBA3155 TaxID=1946058 RepID=UPI0025C6B908|nr:hypothetical protein [Arsukibacterium sp. UBA3155]|tara:strand:- start:21540 stop:25661 length:4122 start_codon:yes stop_codon:yes gene_type:complete